MVLEPIAICGVLDASIYLDQALHERVMFDPAPDPVADVVAAELEAFEVPPPMVRPAKISLKNAPSSMEQLASQWRGAR